MVEEKQKQALIEEIQRRIKYLISTDRISDTEKVVIARKALSIIKDGQREQVVK